MTENEVHICTYCRHDLPFSNFTKNSQNPIEKSFYGLVPIKAATSLFLFHKKGKVQKLIHELKYKNNKRIGIFAADILGNEIDNSNRFGAIDLIIPVPLHKDKLKRRGYNQNTSFGLQLAKILKATYTPNQLIKIEDTQSQTKKSRYNRWENLKNNFLLKNPTLFENKTILLIDDVSTTGATIEACCLELLKAKNSTIYLATIAYVE
ncbi:ComF family protein [Flavicella sediminum]|uniref:ComF family protein n=1 Tax=Flavicella sediminum TaxID=2585141 RepID=UPI001FB707A7|nr:phosphoribosyltransferase family protein [Flavicella sediminum]